MSEHLIQRKTNTLPLTQLDGETLSSSALEVKNTQALIMEAVSKLQQSKGLLQDIAFKEQVIRDQCLESRDPQRYARLQSDIAKIAIRDYDSAMSMIRYLQNENDFLKGKNQQ